MTADTEKLKALALAANDLPDTTQPFVSSTGQVVICTFSLKGEQLHTVGNFYDAANPATVLELCNENTALRAEVERLRARFEYIEDHATTSGGGKGFTVTFFVPVDHEDIGCGIDAAIEKEKA